MEIGMTLTADSVSNIIRDCLYKADELPADGSMPPDAVKAEGVVSRFAFHPARLASHKGEIASLLDELPPEFNAKVAGGWTFLNACMDRNGVQWGEHRNIDELLCLGIASDLAEYVMPREMWSMLPGGMPYFAVKTEPLAA